MNGDLERVIKAAFAQIKAVTPVNKRNTKSRGNLKEFGVKFELGQNEAHLYVDEKIAPYMKYTNEPWHTFAPPLFGKTNPNEGWFDRAVISALLDMAAKTGGDLR